VNRLDRKRAASPHKTSPSSTESPLIWSNTTNLPNAESRESASKPLGTSRICSNYSESDMCRPCDLLELCCAHDDSMSYSTRALTENLRTESTEYSPRQRCLSELRKIGSLLAFSARQDGRSSQLHIGHSRLSDSRYREIRVYRNARLRRIAAVSNLAA
jgi:hypothetical protein